MTDESASVAARLPDWEARLSAYLTAHADAVFAWGTCDCALFAAGAVEALTGFDPSALFPGRHKSAAGAARRLRTLGMADVEALADAALERIPAAFARRGDVVMARGSLGVCIGRVAVFVGEEGSAPGLVRLPIAEWQGAWRV